MTGEEMERAIDFLLKSQANLEARISALWSARSSGFWTRGAAVKPAGA
jgi:hypothetical protein